MHYYDLTPAGNAALPLVDEGRGAVVFGAPTPLRGIFGSGGDNGAVRIAKSPLRSFELGGVSIVIKKC